MGRSSEGKIGDWYAPSHVTLGRVRGRTYLCKTSSPWRQPLVPLPSPSLQGENVMRENEMQHGQIARYRGGARRSPSNAPRLLAAPGGQLLAMIQTSLRQRMTFIGVRAPCSAAGKPGETHRDFFATPRPAASSCIIYIELYTLICAKTTTFFARHR
jgi:hypothetical protein